MSGQMVLRGGSCATLDHIRASTEFLSSVHDGNFQEYVWPKIDCYYLCPHANDNSNKDKFLNDIILGLSSIPNIYHQNIL